MHSHLNHQITNNLGPFYFIIFPAFKIILIRQFNSFVCYVTRIKLILQRVFLVWNFIYYSWNKFQLRSFLNNKFLFQTPHWGSPLRDLIIPHWAREFYEIIFQYLHVIQLLPPKISWTWVTYKLSHIDKSKWRLIE